MYCAFVGLNKKLCRMNGTYMKIEKNVFKLCGRQTQKFNLNLK